jgi:hypothetical protein
MSTALGVESAAAPPSSAAAKAPAKPASARPSGGRMVWLVKLPPYVAAAFKAKSAEASREARAMPLGSISIAPGATKDTPTVKLHIDSDAPDMPRDYTLQLLEKAPASYAFHDRLVPAKEDPPASSSLPSATSSSSSSSPSSSSSSSTSAAAPATASGTAPPRLVSRGAVLDAAVSHLFLAKPDNSPEYAAMIRARSAAARAPKRTLQQVGADETERHTLRRDGVEVAVDARAMSAFRSGFVAASASSASASASLGGQAANMGGSKPPPKDKKVRDEERIEADILTAFGERPYWRMDALSERVNQPLSIVKEYLPKFAQQVTAGEFKTSYELREQWRMVPNPAPKR